MYISVYMYICNTYVCMSIYCREREVEGRREREKEREKREREREGGKKGVEVIGHLLGIVSLPPMWVLGVELW